MASPKQAAQSLGRLGQKIEQAALSGLRSGQEFTHRLAVKQSSGSHSTAELQKIARKRGAGGYSRRNPAGNYDPSKINAQSGEFRSHWQKGSVFVDSGGDAHAPVTNTSSKAGLFDGNPHGHMRDRPVASAVVRKAEQTVVSRIQSALSRLLR